MHVVIYVAGFALWPVLFGALAARLLGVEVGLVRGVLSGLAGVGVGAAMSNAVTGGARGTQNFIAYVTFAVVGALAAIALLDFLARPTAMVRLQPSFGSIPHPVRAVRRRVARGRRYTSIILIVRRHGLVSALAHRARPATIEHSQARERRFGMQLSQALQEAGGMFVKLGQVLSTRPDLLGERVAKQLSVLQDRVEPADQAAIERLLRTELNRSLHEIFERFDAVPLAAASIGQVHRARLRSGPEVVVKVQRPGIEQVVERDLDIVLAIAGRLDAAGGAGRRVGAADLAQGFAENLRQELDYTIEARNTRAMKELLEGAGVRYRRSSGSLPPAGYWCWNSSMARRCALPTRSWAISAPRGAIWPAACSRASSPRFSRQAWSTPTPTRATFSCSRTARSRRSTSGRSCDCTQPSG